MNDIIPILGANDPYPLWQIIRDYGIIFPLVFVVTLATTWICRNLALKWRIMDYPDGDVKPHTRPTPYLGGVGIWLGLMVGLIIGFIVLRRLSIEIPSNRIFNGLMLIGIGMGATIACFVGLVDDIYNIKPWKKLLGQTIAASALIFVGMRPDLSPLFVFFNISLPDVWVTTLSIPLVIFIILGATNSVNLLDGLDGLCAGVTAIIAVGLFILSVSLAILDIAHAHGIPVIEDCCLALGSKYKGRMVGTFGKASYFSFQWNKPYTTGLGGMAAIYDKELAEKINDLCRESLRTPSGRASYMLTVQRIIYWMFIYPRTTALATNLFRWMTKKRLVIGSSCNDEFIPEMPDDFFMAMGPSQKGAGARQLKKVDANMAHRRKMSKLYDELLTEAGFNIPAIPGYMDPVLVRYPLRVSDKQKVLSEAPSQQVEIGSWFECPLHPLETPMHLYDYQQGMCPEAEKASREVINLPLHGRVNENTVRKTVEFIAKYKQRVRKSHISRVNSGK